MSKRINISYLFSIMLLLLAGCDKDSLLTPSPNGEEPVEILLNAQVVRVSTSITRSDFQDETSFNNGKQIGIFGLRNEGASFTDNPYLNNLTFTNNAGVLTGTGKIYFPSGKTTSYLYGYYPYTKTEILYKNGDEISIPVKGGLSGTIDATWTDAETDPLHATATPTIERASENSVPATPSPVEVTLSFRHKMAQLQIMVNTKNDDYKLQEIITTFSAHQHGYMNIRNGEIISANSTEEVCTETFNDVSFTSATTAQSIHSVLPGKNAIKKIQVKVKMKGEADGAVYTAFDAEGEARSIDLTAGCITAVTINFNPNTTTKATLDDTWSTSEEHNFEYNK